MGLGVTLGATQALILTIALTIEILFLAVVVCGELLDLGVPRVRAATIAGPTVLAAMLAAAALLYLVVEELLVEAHEETETPLLGAMFFAGFLPLYILAQLGG